MISKSKLLKKKKIRLTALIKPKSPIRLNIKAFKADLVACRRLFQKLINTKEQIPIPSHPKNKTIKLLLETSNSIKKVNNDKTEKNLIILKSNCIYPIEYRCTNPDIKLIISIIVIERLSKINSQLTCKTPILNQLPKLK